MCLPLNLHFKPTDRRLLFYLFLWTLEVTRAICTKGFGRTLRHFKDSCMTNVHFRHIWLNWRAVLCEEPCNYELNEFGVLQRVLSCRMSKSRPSAVSVAGSFPPVYDMNRQEKNSPPSGTQGSHWIMWTKTGGISDSPHFCSQTLRQKTSLSAAVELRLTSRHCQIK